MVEKRCFVETCAKKIKENQLSSRSGPSKVGGRSARQTLAMTHSVPAGQRHSLAVTANLRSEIASEIGRQRCKCHKNTERDARTQQRHPSQHDAFLWRGGREFSFPRRYLS